MRKGQKHSEISKQKNREKHLGKKHSDLTKKLCKEIAFKKGYGKWMKGKKMSKETIQKGIDTKRKKYNGDMVSKEKRQQITKWLKEVRIGKGNPAWKGGLSFEPYGIGWSNTLRRSIRERDNYVCQICFGEGFDVHHIDYCKTNMNPENLICLCRSCHSKTNTKRNYWINYFKKNE